MPPAAKIPQILSRCRPDEAPAYTGNIWTARHLRSAIGLADQIYYWSPALPHLDIGLRISKAQVLEIVRYYRPGAETLRGLWAPRPGAALSECSSFWGHGLTVLYLSPTEEK